MHDFTKLEVWKRSHELSKDVYRLTARFPSDERHGLISQMRRCAVSIPANIAEGSGSMHTKNFIRHLSISSGSSYELQHYLILSRDLGYLSQENYDHCSRSLLTTKKMLFNLIRKLGMERE